jgi:hypothetical protein
MIKFLLLCVFIFSCTVKHVNENPTLPDFQDKFYEKDSLQLLSLTKQVYKWHLTNNNVDFAYQYLPNNDSIFTGIDWEKHKTNLKNLRATNFFTEKFLSRYNLIAYTLDTSIRKSDIKFRNTKNGIPIWSTNSDIWCNCQDYPSKYWARLSINSISVSEDSATFRWMWNSTSPPMPSSYELKAKRIKSSWRIDYIEGFSSYYSVSKYDSLIGVKN